MANTGNTVINDAIAAIKKSTGLIAPTEAEIEAESTENGANKDGTNRQARRLKKKIGKNNNP